MPTMAGAFFAGAVFAIARADSSSNFSYGGFASLMCSGMLRALEGFVQNVDNKRGWLLDGGDDLVNWVAM